MRHILKCPKCRQYTMQDSCPGCGARTENPKPARYSLGDEYGSYRRKAKKDMLIRKEVL